MKKKKCRKTLKSIGKYLIKYISWRENFLDVYKKNIRFSYLLKKFQKNFKNKIRVKLTSAIKVQSFCRMAIIQLRNDCINKDDLVGETIFDIPSFYFIRLREKENFFGFDIRFLYKYFKMTKKEVNPYTNGNFNTEDVP